MLNEEGLRKMIIKRPWDERLVSNCTKIKADLIDRYYVETGISPYNNQFNEQDFIFWIGLKDTPTAYLYTRLAVTSWIHSAHEPDAVGIKMGTNK